MMGRLCDKLATTLSNIFGINFSSLFLPKQYSSKPEVDKAVLSLVIFPVMVAVVCWVRFFLLFSFPKGNPISLHLNIKQIRC
jgi:hypothetical protein